jgi:hypothetical protein
VSVCIHTYNRPPSVLPVEYMLAYTFSYTNHSLIGVLSPYARRIL